MAKKSEQKSSSKVVLLLAILVIVLAFTLGLVAKRYFDEQMEASSYLANKDDIIARYQRLDSQEDANVIATSVLPLVTNSAKLQSYISAISRQTGRDIVVVDAKEIILADTIPANVGKEYMHDKGEELLQTVKTGQTGNFVEISNDYPEGVAETSVPIRDADGNIMGAVVLSSSNIFQ